MKLLKEGNLTSIFHPLVFHWFKNCVGTSHKYFFMVYRFSGTIIGVGSMSTSPWANSDWRSLKVIKIFKFVGRMPFFLCICFLEHLRAYVS